MASSSRSNPKRKKTEVPIVVPVVQTRPLTKREKTLTFEKTASAEAKRAHDEYFSKSKVWLERGIDFSKIGKELKEIFKDRGWLDIAMDRKDKINVSMVSEFYSVLSTYDADTVEEMTYIPLRSVNVTFYPAMINVFYGLAEIPEEEDYQNVWGLEHPMALQTKAYEAQQAFDPTAEWIENRFAYGNCIRDIRAIKQFLGHNVCPSTHVCAFGREEVVIAWAMVNDIPINLGKLIFSKACEFASTRYRGGRLPFPSLISALYELAEVPVLPSDRTVSPYIPPIGLKLRALPTGIIDYNNPNRQQQQPPPPPPFHTQVPRPPRQSHQPQQSQVEAMFQHLVQAQARTDANIALACEKNRQWAEDIRVGQRGYRDAMSEFDPRFAEISARHPYSQPDPYTMPDWIPPIPPPVIYQDYTPSSIGQGGMFTGTPGTSLGMGGVTSVADVTAGFGSFGLQGSVSMSTMRTETSFRTSVSDPQQFSYGIHTTQSQGADFTSILSTFGSSSSQYDLTGDIDLNYDEDE